MPEEIINKKLNELNPTTGPKPGRPTIPVSIALQEAEDLFDWCMKDKEILMRAGLDWKLVEDIPERTRTLREIEAKWNSDKLEFRKVQADMKHSFRSALNLRRKLLHYFYYAFENNKNEYSKVQRISEGNSNADIIQSLFNLSALGQKHKDQLKTIGLDLSILDQASVESVELAELYAKFNTAQRESRPDQELRNKAYTHLKDAVNKIRHIGQFVFWENEDRLEGYVSGYLRKRNQVRKKKKEK